MPQKVIILFIEYLFHNEVLWSRKFIVLPQYVLLIQYLHTLKILQSSYITNYF